MIAVRLVRMIVAMPFLCVGCICIAVARILGGQDMDDVVALRKRGDS